jgi:hypothetical protein
MIYNQASLRLCTIITAGRGKIADALRGQSAIVEAAGFNLTGSGFRGRVLRAAPARLREGCNCAFPVQPSAGYHGARTCYQDKIRRPPG